MLELIAGIVVAFVAVGAVLQPLLTAARPAGSGPGQGEADVEFEDIEESASPKVQALLVLKEIEFDHATGKLSDTDYEGLKAKYSRVALDAIKAEEGAVDADSEDEAEALVRRVASGAVPVCPKCGPRPEADAAFCSDCGSALRSAPAADGWAFCESCGVKLSSHAKFCPGCGAKVGAGTAGVAR
jgi:hypothetical protein